jgi:raffinose/stachyose/melibiose transport system permease protein
VRSTPRREGVARSHPELWRYAFLLPAFAVYAVFVLWPLAQTVRISFYDWNGLTVATPVGLANYVEALTDPSVFGALTHSLVFVFFYSLLPVAIGLLLAGIMSRIRIHGLTFFRAVLFLPQVLSTVVVAVAWRWMYSDLGPINEGLRALGLDGVSWLGSFTFALPAVGLIGTWIMFGLCMVLFIAGVQKIPGELYEAARMDGAGAVREFFTVTLPGLRGEVMVALVFTLTIALRNFDIVWNTTMGGPGESTTVPSVYIYEGAFITRDLGQAASISVLLTILILAITTVVIGLLRERDA